MKKLMFIFTVLLFSIADNTVFAQSWSLTGNTATNTATDYIGTSDNKALKIKTNNQVRMYFKTNGDVGVGTQTPLSKLHVNGVVTATGGTSTDWNSAFSWGNHALAGYLSSESDPQVGVIGSNLLSKWNGSALVSSNVTSSGTFVGVNTSTGIGSAQLVVNSASTGFGGMTVNTTGASGLPFYGYANNNLVTTWTYLDQVTGSWGVYNQGNHLYLENDGDMRLGSTTTTTDSKLEILGKVGNTSNVVNVTGSYVGLFDAKGINSTFIANPGYGYGVYGTGGYMGVRGQADATTYAGSAYGVYGAATGTAGTRIGVFGTASGGTENYGGYFTTKVYASEIRIGSTQAAAGYLLAVDGKVICEELRIQNATMWPDYVFNEDYKLKNLDVLEKEIQVAKHLPGVPSAEEVKENGVAVGEMQRIMMEKIEELTLYVIQLKKENDKLNTRINQVENK